MTGSEARKWVAIKESTYNRLKAHGNMGDTFDDVINTLFDESDRLKGLED